MMQPGPVAAFLLFLLGLLAVSWLPARNPDEPASSYWIVAVVVTAVVAAVLLASRRAELAAGTRGRDGPGKEALIGLVGPGVTALGGLALATTFVLLRMAGTTAMALDAAAWAARTLLGVAAIRLLPIPAMDGFRVLRAGLWGRLGDPLAAGVRAARLTRFGGVGVMAGGMLYSLQAEDGWGYTVGLLAWLVMVSSHIEETRARVAQRFDGVKVADMMHPVPAHGPGWLMLDAYLAGGPEPTDVAPVLLDRFDGGCGGLLEARSVDAIPRERRVALRALDLATELERVPTARPEQSVADAAHAARLARGATGVLVVDDDEPVGWLALDEVRRRLNDR